MDFLNSLNEVRKNRKNFKEWETQQKDEEAKREELAKRRQHSEEELQAAKAYGEKIIDIVDIMDNHSENVAENVETAIQPMTGLATTGTGIGGMALVIKKITIPNDKKIQELKKGIYENKVYQELAEKITESDKLAGKKDYWFSSYDFVYGKRRIDKIRDSELKRQAKEIYNNYKKQVKPLINKTFKGFAGVFAATIGAFIASTIFAAKLQTDSSKIARYQARKELEDPKNFVMYTPEQIAQAKEELKQHPELTKKEKKSKLKDGMFSSIINLFKDRKAYNQDKSARTDDSKKVTRELTEQEIIEAKKDQEVIQRTVRIINNEAEKNSENMEVAANVIMGATPVLGVTVGKGINWVLKKLGVIEKFTDSTIKNYANEEAKAEWENFKKLKDDAPGYTKKWNDFVEKLWADAPESKYNIDDVEIKVRHNTKLKDRKISEILKKGLATALSHKYGRNWIVAGVSGLMTTFAGLMIGLKLQKSAARAGRYTAKRELEQHPENFIGYTKEDYEEVKDVKSTKKDTNKIKEYALFIPTVIKQYIAYNKYKAKDYKEKQALNEILKKQEVSETQMKDAKNLQRKIFNTFEKVDDNSQVYSESMEAATEIAQPFVWYGGIALATSPLIYTGIQTVRGKMSPAILLNKIVSKLETASGITKKQWFKNYLKDVAENIPDKVQSIDVKTKPIGSALKGVDLKDGPILGNLSKISRNIKSSIADFNKLTDDEQQKAFGEIAQNIETIAAYSDEMGANLKIALRNIRWSNKEERADMLNLLFNPSELAKKNYSEEHIQHLFNMMTWDIKEESKGLVKLISGISGSMEELTGSLGDLNNTEKLSALIGNLLSEQGLIKFQHDGNITISNKVVDFAKKVGVIKPTAGSESLPVNADGMITGVPQDQVEFLIKGITSKIQTMSFKDAMKAFGKNKTTKETIQEMIAKFNKMTDQEFEEFAESIHFTSLDKKTALEILPKVQKILDNLPQEELDGITNVIIKELQEHPDEFIKLVQSGKAGKLFMTPKLEKALAIAGVSWTVFSIAMTYTVEAIMADMQLKAGRLGVMKAMESLDDPRYYANIEPTETSTKKETPTPSKTIAQNSYLLDRFKK